MRLEGHSELSADHAELSEKAEEYEGLVIDVLDCIREKETAFNLLTLLVRTHGASLHTRASLHACDTSS